MPVRSEAQRRYLNMKFGHKWVKKHHFDQKGKLPAHAKAQDERARLAEAFRRRGKAKKGKVRGSQA